MNDVVSGNIDSIYTKTVQTKFGDKIVYHAMVDGNDVNLGFKHQYAVGETVNLDVEHKYGGYQLIPSAGNVSSPGNMVAGSNSAPAKRTPAPKSGPAFPVATNTKDISIIRQSSLNRAVDVVEKLQAIGLFIPGNEQEYLDKVLEVAYMFTDFGSGQREVKQAAAMSGYED